MYKYNNSAAQMIMNIFQEHEWLPWKFTTCPKHFWNDDKNKRIFLDWAGKQLGVKELKDWYNITQMVGRRENNY
jgi:hypothetical protein